MYMKAGVYSELPHRVHLNWPLAFAHRWPIAINTAQNTGLLAIAVALPTRLITFSKLLCLHRNHTNT